MTIRAEQIFMRISRRLSIMSIPPQTLAFQIRNVYLDHSGYLAIARPSTFPYYYEEPFSRMLKKSLFSPARPRRAETRLFPCSVLAALRGSKYRSVRLASSLAVALLNSLLEHPALCTPVIPDVQISEIPACPQSVSAAC